MNQIKSITYIISLTLILAACQNGGIRRNFGSGSSISGSDDPGRQINATIISVEPSANTPYKATVRFDTDPTRTVRPINELCSVSVNNAPNLNPCECRFERTVINANSSAVLSYQKVDRTQVDEIVDSYGVRCPMPNDFPSQYPNGSTYRIQIEPGGSSGQSVVTNQFSKLYGTQSSGQSDFELEDGTKFVNIHEYSCYEKEVVNQKLVNKVLEVTRPLPSSGGQTQGERKNIPLGTQFCASRGGTGIGECNVTQENQFSSMSFYYRFYAPNYKSIQKTDGARYTCPKVGHVASEKIPAGGSFTPGPSVYPLSTRFALAKDWSPEFPVGIEAAASIFDPNNSETGPSPCRAINGSTVTSNGSPSDDSIVFQCLGYASKPKADGTCGYVRDSVNGKIRYLTRLRKYVALFEQHADSTGRIVKNGARGVDATVLVPDRVVQRPGNDPLKFYTMLGPKPCPGAFLDVKGATKAPYFYYGNRARRAGASKEHFVLPYTNGDQVQENGGSTFARGAGRPVYKALGGETVWTDPFIREYNVSTGDNHRNWDNLNVDKMIFPNFDSGQARSCSSVLPYIKYNNDLSVESITALSSTFDANDLRAGFVGQVPWMSPSPLDPSDKRIRLDEVYVRPLEKGKWVYYTEDKTFEACVPAPSNGIKDPPLHFVKLPTGNVSYCSAEYPTQNPRVTEFDKFQNGNFSGMFKNYTSPVRKNQLVGGSNCTTTPTNPTGYMPAEGPYIGGNGSFVQKTYSGFANHGVASGANRASIIEVDHDGNNFIFAGETCDRTVTTSSISGLNAIPLQADPDDIETILAKDPSYQCLVTYDEDNGKAWQATPTGGCCGVTANGADILEPRLKTGVPSSPVPNVNDRRTASGYAAFKRYTATALPDQNGDICGNIQY